MCSDRVLAAVVGVLLACSCSVKEDRAQCPCCLTIDLSSMGHQEEGALTLVYFDGKDTSYTGVKELDPALAELLVKVDRKKLKRGAWIMPGSVFKGRVTAPEGCDFPHVWMGCVEVDCREDEARDTILLHKRWCEVSVTLKGALPTSGIEASVEGNVCGYTAEGECIRGGSNVGVGLVKDAFSFSVPRQLDDSLILRMGNGEPSMRVFALGRLLLEYGYDWDAEDLADVSIVLDLQRSSLDVTISAWRREEDFWMRI